ncbi:MAG: hypothetical protein GF350_17230 [Chitinivibrionales bacterium]|nr:hypothetical protein [Chitinivibrionales bacterium]
MNKILSAIMFFFLAAVLYSQNVEDLTYLRFRESAGGEVGGYLGYQTAAEQIILAYKNNYGPLVIDNNNVYLGAFQYFNNSPEGWPATVKLFVAGEEFKTGLEARALQQGTAGYFKAEGENSIGLKIDAPEKALIINSGNVGVGVAEPGNWKMALSSSDLEGINGLKVNVSSSSPTAIAAAGHFSNDANSSMINAYFARLGAMGERFAALFQNGNVIIENGKLGLNINETSLENDAEFAGRAAIGQNYCQGNYTAPANGLIVEGSVGIGTHEVENILHIASNADSYLPALKLNNRANPNSPVHGVGIEFQMSNAQDGPYSYKKAEIRAIATAEYANDIAMTFWTGGSTDADHQERMRIAHDGKVAIGTTNPGDYMLKVNGDLGITGKIVVNEMVKTKEVLVTQSGLWADYVFDDSYKLRPLEEVEKFIRENRHLPGIPDENQIKEKGQNVGEMQAKLLEKVEELTLYLIEQNKGLAKLKEENESLKGRLAKLEKSKKRL